MKVLGISAAASAESRSELLLDSLLDEFRGGGADVKKVSTRNLTIFFCDGLHCCEKTGKCKLTDDMQLLEKAISSSDIVVVSTPIYFTSIPAKLKLIVDRCQAPWVRKNILGFLPSPKKGFFIGVAGQHPDFCHAETVVRAFFSVFSVEFCGKFYLAGTDKIDDKRFFKALEDVKGMAWRE